MKKIFFLCFILCVSNLSAQKEDIDIKVIFEPKLLDETTQKMFKIIITNNSANIIGIPDSLCLLDEGARDILNRMGFNLTSNGKPDSMNCVFIADDPLGKKEIF